MLMLKDRGCWWQNRPKPSPTSQSCRQHISSPTSVTNIDVANKLLTVGIPCLSSQLGCWWLHNGDSFKILMNESFWWWLPMLKNSHQHIKIVISINCHHHRHRCSRPMIPGQNLIDSWVPIRCIFARIILVWCDGTRTVADVNWQQPFLVVENSKDQKLHLRVVRGHAIFSTFWGHSTFSIISRVSRAWFAWFLTDWTWYFMIWHDRILVSN